jgi:hypothetical protein
MRFFLRFFIKQLLLVPEDKPEVVFTNAKSMDYSIFRNFINDIFVEVFTLSGLIDHNEQTCSVIIYTVHLCIASMKQ